MAGRATRKSAKRKSKRKPSPARRATHARRTSPGQRRKASPRKWSARATRESDALDLDKGVFKLRSPKTIAASLKRSAECSKRRKADPYRSALSMLVFYINRAGKNLSASRKRILNKAKDELRAQFGRD